MPVTAFCAETILFKDGRFVVAQFTDLHWMPGSAKCAKTTATIRAVLREHPDIAILSGDVVTDDPTMDGWKKCSGYFQWNQDAFCGDDGETMMQNTWRLMKSDFLLKSPTMGETKRP